MDAPGEPRLLGAVGRAGRVRGGVGGLGGRLDARAAAVGDRVAGDRVQPRRHRPALAAVCARRAPDRRERLLHGVLGPAAVAEPPDREAEHGSRVAPVEVAEGVTVAVGDA